MSFFQRIGSIVENVKEFYSEINAATLTGAIDVIVVEQEDGTLVSSPFHVRFGKLGVLKAKEKVVDLEINGEPVEIQMKLDDTGAAFFVEEVAETEEVGSPQLATSPIPDQSGFQWRKERALAPGTFRPRKLAWEGEGEAEEGGKRGKKKRRVKKKGHGRQGSRSSLGELVTRSMTDSMFTMDDVNDAEGETDEEEELGDSPTLRDSSLARTLSFPLPSTSAGHNLLGSSAPARHRIDDQLLHPAPTGSAQLLLQGALPLHIPKSSSEAEALEALLSRAPENLRSQSVSHGFHFFSDGEEDPTEVPRPSTPGVLSDSELETSRREGEEEQGNVWRWGELPTTTPAPVHQVVVKEEVKAEGAEGRRSWFGGWSSKRKQEPIDVEGCYLDDLMKDPDKLAYYLKPVSGVTSSSGVQTPPIAQSQTPPVVQSPPNVISQLAKLNEDSKVEEGTSLDLSPESAVADSDPLDTVVDIEETEEPENRDPLDLSDVPLAILGPAREEDCESGHGPSLPMSPHSTRLASSFHESEGEGGDLPSLAAKHLPDLAASLCGGLDTGTVSLVSFEQHGITYEQFLERLKSGTSLLEDPRLVIRLHEKYLSWSKAAPILLSIMLFRQPLPPDVVEDIVKDGIDVNVNLSAEEVKDAEGARGKKSWFRWSWGATEANTSQTGAVVVEEVKLEVVEGLPGVEEVTSEEEREEVKGEEEEEEGGQRCRKTLRLSSEKLVDLNLRPGSNEVEFSVTTAFQGTTVCRCHIYLWRHTDKVVISDIDGTITKSDVLGHILPVIGRDWAQSGVAQLFSKIRANGYHIMYLSARAIGQASMTKEYLESVRQGEVCLPDGPVFLNPDSLIHALKREVIDKNPEEFKIRCLMDIRRCFEGRNILAEQPVAERKNPFFAGYGNRPNDALAYRAVGIPVSRIFTINPSGQLKQELTPNFQTSYEYQAREVDSLFPICRYTAEIMQSTLELANPAELRNMLEMQRQNSIYFEAVEEVERGEKYTEQDGMVDQVFPPIGKDGFDPDFRIQEFSTFGFWKDGLPEINLDDLAEIIPQSQENEPKT